MERKILLISDSPSIHLEVILNTVRLAQRTESRVVALVLLPRNGGAGKAAGPGMVIRAGDEDISWKEAIARYGWEASVEVRIGDPASEFMKYVAENGRFEALVWAGSESAMGPHRDRHHWVNKVAGLVPGPWVAARTKK